MYIKLIEFCVKNGSSICAIVKEGKEICASFAIAPLTTKVMATSYDHYRENNIHSVLMFSDVRDPLGALKCFFIDKWALHY